MRVQSFWTSHTQFVLTRVWLVVVLLSIHRHIDHVGSAWQFETHNWAEQKSGPVFSIWIRVAVKWTSIYWNLLFASLSHAFTFLFCLELFLSPDLQKALEAFKCSPLLWVPQTAWCLQSYICLIKFMRPLIQFEINILIEPEKVTVLLKQRNVFNMW